MTFWKTVGAIWVSFMILNVGIVAGMTSRSAYVEKKPLLQDFPLAGSVAIVALGPLSTGIALGTILYEVRED